MNKFFLLLVALLVGVLLTVSCSSGSGNIQGEIKLNLIEHIEGKDLGGTTVKIKGRNETAATDKDGKFSLKNVDAGTYTVTISHVGWDSKDVEVKVSVGKVNELDETLDYSLGILKGGVSYADYEEYELYDETKFKTAKLTLTKDLDETIIDIGETGTFSKVDLAEGEYNAVISADGYEKEELSVNIEKNKVLTVAAVKLKFVMGGITGKVVDKSNDINEGFSVKVVKVDNSSVVEELVTENDGVFRFDFIEKGEYRIQIEKENYLIVTKDIVIEAKKVIDTGEFELTAIDSTILNTTIDEKSAPLKNTNETDASFDFRANFEEAAFECSLDSTDGWEPCTSPAEYENLTDGVHIFKVRAILGEVVEETPAEYSWTVDTVPPVITYFEYPILKTNLKSGQISFNVDTTPEQLICTLDETKVPCSEFTAEFTDIDAGKHIFDVKAVDEAQNEGSASFEWTVVDNDGWYSVETIYGSEAVCAIALDGTLNCKYGDEAFSEIEGLWREVSLFSFENEGSVTETICGIQFDSSLWCWGSNKGGQLGNGTETDSAEPVQIEGLWKKTVVRAIEDSGYQFFISVCAINYENELYCWGQTNTTVKNKNPLKISDVPANIIDFHRSYYFNDNFTDILLFGDDGKIYPMERMTVSPDSIVDLEDFIVLSNRFDSQSHMCGINSPGELMCWGNNSEGQTGGGNVAGLWNDVITHEHIPYYFDEMSLTEVPMTAALSSEGELYLWGHGFGETPAKLNDDKYQALKVSGSKTLNIYLIDENDALKKLTVSGRGKTPQLIRLGFITLSAQISCGKSDSTDFTLFLGEADGIYSFGQNGSSGNLGNNESGTTKLIPSNIGGQWSVFSAGSLGGCGIKTDGKLFCWGKELSFADQRSPKQIGTDSNWYQVATGSSHSCALKTDGSLYCIGSNSSGQIGDGTNTTATQMTKINTPANWKNISTFSRHTCGIDSNDELYCWGENGSGQLGDGLQTDRNTPFKTGGSDMWREVSAGLNHTCAIKSDGTLWCTGNYTGTVTTSLTQVGTALWSRVSSGAGFTCMINSSEKIYCFGKNDAYQLGNGTTNDSELPTQISFNATLWKEISAGYNHTCGIRTGGNIMCWGTHPGFIDLKTVTY